ncbi:hypothetical protein EV401DRAFT_1913478 [Pisolithus croceorrhizus]|nr:hypothetical protein EV401DRAFT_1913478 [Pisolithus croceorrhizus]
MWTYVVFLVSSALPPRHTVYVWNTNYRLGQKIWGARAPLVSFSKVSFLFVCLLQWRPSPRSSRPIIDYDV